ncbi:hypothetical protein [uncultured Streptomyces sp.]|uniref:hypothetical protein n=1 Tax=uncultured Streptomyces sp. TaxID=174707 RepID=UPI00261B2433|nr:hypothetical protein [uncultured Streptomyces sp.]
MTPRQHLLRSGFTAAPTAHDVLAGTDLTGKNVRAVGLVHPDERRAGGGEDDGGARRLRELSERLLAA